MDDIIAAVSTPPGEGGIGIVRVSGAGCAGILAGVFSRGKAGRAPGLAVFQDRRMQYGRVMDGGAVVDEVLAVFMEGPRTYTGEDVAEIHCHGGPVALRRVLGLLLRSGARLAEPGEFTKRAFLNGRLDLAQAEAVIDLVRAKTDKTFEVAIRQLDGSLSVLVKNARDELADLLADVAADLDYPDEEEARLDGGGLAARIGAIAAGIEALSATSKAGRVVSEGLRAVIAGKPNVGKSSILNALLGESRAIVTELPGTTRDVIEEGLDVGGVHVRLMDTAGMRDAVDRLERLGVDRSKDAFNRADLVLLALDASSPLDGDDMEVIRHVGERPVIVLLNKSDLDSRIDEGRVAAELPGAAAIRVSAKEGWGLDGVHGEIRRLVFSGDAAQGDSPLVTNARHAALLGRAAAELQEALSLAGRGMPADIVETPLRVAWELLGEITGDAAADDIIERVFAKFCLGK